MTDTSTPKIDVLKLAAAAEIDPRTAAKILRGERVRGMHGERGRRKAIELGMLPPRISR